MISVLFITLLIFNYTIIDAYNNYRCNCATIICIFCRYIYAKNNIVNSIPNYHLLETIAKYDAYIVLTFDDVIEERLPNEKNALLQAAKERIKKA